MEIKEISIQNKEYPKMLKIIKNPPKKLYVIGDISLLNKNSIAIVGTRYCTEYGKKYAIKFAKELSNAGICIVSGMAKGIDSYAHFSSIGTKGNTIAVLGTGINSIYPKENIKLFNSIIENGGCVISEQEPNIGIEQANFPARNRIISGLSMATLVVEAKYRSGSLITARNSLEQNKKVFCIPKSLDDTKVAGLKRLIKMGAKIIMNTQEIVDELNLNILVPYKTIDTTRIIKEYETMILNKECISMPNIKEEYKNVYKILKQEQCNVNMLSKKLNTNIPEIMQKLTMMELEGIIEETLSNEYKIRGD